MSSSFDATMVPLDEMENNHKNFNMKASELGDLVSKRDLSRLEDVGGLPELANRLQTDLKTGLSASEASHSYRERVRTYGTNIFREPPPATFWRLWLDTFKDTTLVILTVSATVSLILGLIPGDWLGEQESNNDWIEAVAIFVTIFIVATVTAGNNYTKDKQFRELNKAKHNFPVKVVRGGVESQINNFDVLVGDLVILDTGDQVPADGVYVSGFDLYVDESRVNGEADAVRKSERDPFLLSGCQITDGVGRMLVVATGMNSEWGKTLSKLQEEPDPTPLQEKLDELAILISKVGIAFAGLVFVVLTIYWFMDDVKGLPWEWAKVRGIVQNFIVAVTVIIVAVPEGLPLAVTISLAYSMKQMMSDANLVRHLAACETMGGATNICSDKTGTLTENRMTVVQGWVAGSEFNSVPPSAEFSLPVYSLLVEGIAINSKGYIHQENGKPVEFIGNKTECALLVFIGKIGANYVAIREAAQVQKLYAFSSARKRMTSIVTNPAGGYRMYIKGASEIVLGRCKSVLGPDGHIQDLTPDLHAKLAQRIDDMASQGLRTLTLAFRDIPELQDWKEPPEDDICLIGIVGIMDPIRPLVVEAVRACQFAGITVRMVTGDNIKTAKKIAEDCGIYKPATGLAIEGPEFAALTDQELDERLPNLQVLARASPMDKFRLVERLKHHDEVVAVTGDGTNDAAALKKADVGLAMGIAGTEVAKEASDIIILDDNFVSIVRSCMWGRNVYDNVRKFLQFQLTVNVVALVTAFVGAVSRYGTPLTAVQLLWVNLIMDTFAALALGTEKPTPDLLNRKPYGRNSSLVSRVMYRNIVGQSILQILIVMVLLYKGVEIFGLDVSGNTTSDATVHYTLVFNVFVFLQIFNELNSRKVGVEMNVFKGFFDNYVFSAVLIFTIVIQILVVEFGGIFTNTVHLPLNLWVWSLVLGLLSIPFGFLLRMIPVQLEEFEKPTAESVSNELAFLVHREGNNEGGKPTSAQVAPGMVKLEV